MEGTSEDPHLLSEFARAKIRGLQGVDLSIQVLLLQQLNILQAMPSLNLAGTTIPQNYQEILY